MGGQQTCPRNNIYQHVNGKLGRQHTKAPLGSRHQSIYELTVPTQPMMWMM